MIYPNALRYGLTVGFYFIHKEHENVATDPRESSRDRSIVSFLILEILKNLQSVKLGILALASYRIFMFFVYALLTSNPLAADEGQWPFNMLPKEIIYQKYGVELGEEAVIHLQKSCLRISLGGSGSFVSPNALVMTNHHVGAKAIYNLSTEQKNLMVSGYYASTREEELKCPGIYVEQLIEIRDITAVIQAAVKEGRRLEAMQEEAKKAQDTTGLQPEIVTLYGGACYNLYLYKRYSDVRLVFAPEKQIAFFGGDADNFEYPRFDLDVCFFRVYENDVPLKTADYLSWSEQGPQENELLFVAGHPGNTKRLYTADHLCFLQHQEMPLILSLLQRRIDRLQEFSRQSPAYARMAQHDLFSYQNGYKVLKAIDLGLQNKLVIAEKRREEGELLFSQQEPYRHIKEALDHLNYPAYFCLEGRGAASFSRLFVIAKHLVRASEERSLPNQKRLKEYSDSEIDALEQALFSPQPIYKEQEALFLKDSFTRLATILGKEHPAVVAALGGKTIEAKVDELLQGTKLFDITVRKELYKSLEVVDDPFIELVKKLEPFARPLRKERDLFETKEQQSYAQIAALSRGKPGSYPDATFTLRLSFGVMKGYEDQGQWLYPMTHIKGLFAHARAHQDNVDYDLPDRWARLASLKEDKTPFNFVSTHDIIGGNSGSPMVNQKGEIVGLIFDGNEQSLFWNIAFDETKGRAISVHSAAITKVLSTVYRAEALVAELVGNRLASSVKKSTIAEETN